MKQMLLLTVFAVLVLISCRRPGAPEPLICSDRSVYQVLDTIKMNNCSKNFSKQRWILPDGSPSTLESVYYVAQNPGIYTFKLYVSDDDFVNEYETMYQIQVNP
ncbi:MAG: hypothetical protein KBF25_05205 [Chitinophagaceae bacterium]|jgi:PKD repeat protein|nr:hypothetical protein [Chitinophagaceae bacterium]